MLYVNQYENFSVRGTLARIYKSQEVFIQKSDSFYPTEYECESRFIQSRPVFPKFYDKGLKNKTKCNALHT